MARNHRSEFLHALVRQVTNATCESNHSMVMWIKRLACGFRDRKRFRAAPNSHCGGLDLALRPQPLAHATRHPHREASEFSYREKLDVLLLPYFAAREHDGPIGMDGAQILFERSTLRLVGDALATSGRVRVNTHENDGLLSQENAEWLREPLGSRLAAATKRSGGPEAAFSRCSKRIPASMAQNGRKHRLS